MNDKSETPSLEDRVMKFRMLALPGQPPMMHMGTSYLVEDLWRELAAAKESESCYVALAAAQSDRADKAEAERDEPRDMKAWLRSNVIALTTRDADGCERTIVAEQDCNGPETGDIVDAIRAAIDAERKGGGVTIPNRLWSLMDIAAYLGVAIRGALRVTKAEGFPAPDERSPKSAMRRLWPEDRVREWVESRIDTERRKRTPDQGETALYRHFDKDSTLLYVGVATDHIRRLYAHAMHSAWRREIARIEVAWFPTRREALEAESAAIASEGPKFNQVGKPR